MIQNPKAEIFERLATVANLPETINALEVYYQDLVTEAMEIIPSFQHIDLTTWDKKTRLPEVEISERDYNLEQDEANNYPPSIRVVFRGRADFHDLLPFANDMSAQEIRYNKYVGRIRHGVHVYVGMKLIAPIDPDYFQTLKDLGKVKYQAPYAAPMGGGYTVNCTINN